MIKDCEFCKHRNELPFESPCMACGDGFEQFENGYDVMRWIPCSERLPVPNEFDETGHFFKAYLVQDKWKTMYTALWDGKWWTIWTRGTVINNVIAWMPLPEPYKEVDNGNN